MLCVERHCEIVIMRLSEVVIASIGSDICRQDRGMFLRLKLLSRLALSGCQFLGNKRSMLILCHYCSPPKVSCNLWAKGETGHRQWYWFDTDSFLPIGLRKLPCLDMDSVSVDSIAGNLCGTDNVRRVR